MTDQILTDVDLDDPPTDPPAGCEDPFLWELARRKFELHRRTGAGDCVTCPRWRRCGGSLLARDGLATAMGLKVRESPYWQAFAQIMRSDRERGQPALGPHC
ncbi:hypothetical protein [Catellatospora tritici]|uniref:hypothetical protein n=1 Tax=Catellatospora tritici TaxID=2851566 RepID=UPI001C2D45C3|nr:hypothetical protein [Catellatospora tritici]MBV1854544.1 hypothetical protein [Catellatospora tritici]